MNKNKITRRSLLTALGISFFSYSYYRSIRFPRLSWEPKSLSTNIVLNDGFVEFTDAIKLTNESTDLAFRAFAPSPKLIINGSQNKNLKITMSNVAVDARLVTTGIDLNHIEEVIDGINRTIKINPQMGKTIELSWELPTLEQYSFASIGDTGGGKELEWCIKRAHELDARFLLHLGDFNYIESDYETTIDLFKNAELPVYVTIGNHDFNANGLVYDKFLENIGPLNHDFMIGRTRFINIDSAANVLPYHRGLRADLLDKVAKDKIKHIDAVAFTHRPLHDPREGIDNPHDMGDDGERDWLINTLKEINVKTLLSGHLHIFDRTTFNGIDNIIAGQGLGHKDIMNNKDSSIMLIGNVDKDGTIEYKLENLAMPMELHCHPHTNPVKEAMKKLSRRDDIDRIDRMCNLK